MRTGVAMMACMMLLGCDLAAFSQPPRGGALITAVAEELRQGRPEKAEALVRRRNSLEHLPKIELMDPSDPLYCTEEGVETRLDQAAGIIAAQAIELQAQTPIARYAVFKKRFEDQMEMQDGIFFRAGYCQPSMATLTLAYDRARRPIVEAAQALIAQYRAAAEAAVVGDFDGAVAQALKDEAEDRRRARHEDCLAARQEAEELDPSEDPLIAETIRMRVRHCELIGR